MDYPIQNADGSTDLYFGPIRRAWIRPNAQPVFTSASDLKSQNKPDLPFATFVDKLWSSAGVTSALKGL